MHSKRVVLRDLLNMVPRSGTKNAQGIKKKVGDEKTDNDTTQINIKYYQVYLIPSTTQILFILSK